MDGLAGGPFMHAQTCIKGTYVLYSL